MDLTANSSGLKRQRGSDRIEIDLDALTHFASALVTTDSVIAKNLGIGMTTLKRRLADTPEVAEAYMRGRALSSERLSEAYQKKIDPQNEAKKIDTLALIHCAKQPVERGGLGLVDRTETKHSSNINFTVRVGVRGPEEPKQVEQVPIEITAEPVEDE